MNRRTRTRIALISTVPTLIAFPAICLLAAVGAVPWALLLALPVALAVHAAVNASRLDHGLSKAPDRHVSGRGSL
ncbi:hypothetical protein SAMN05421874_103379 [Nonomuraea maritima]|uniref:Uncharacterized protein n=1 Tax=Nonomuraea maritima TaxID=683260 RepID=A0A1G8X4L4_9ACTN|nr:hypothetical protein [Nonomuraea maritima]SDJ84700.1 hypothetical protein SAMN05421874_103379 [Nonomuraea maritima]